MGVAEGDTRSAGCSSTLALLTTWPTVPPKVWTELTLPSTLRVTVLLLPTKATRPSTSATSTTSWVPTLTKLNLPSDVKNLTTIARNLLDHPGTGKSARDHRRERPSGRLRTRSGGCRGTCVHRHTQNESAHVVRVATMRALQE